MPDLYILVKFLHVAAAIAWVGGGVTMFFLALYARVRRDNAETLRVIDQFVLLAPRWFVPFSLATLLTGLGVAALHGLWDQAWVIIGLAGWAATFATGDFVLKPTAKAIGAAKAEGRTADAEALSGKFVQVAKFDYTVLFVVVADMVLRPHWGDVVVLGAMGVVVAGAAVLFLVPLSKRAPAAA